MSPRVQLCVLELSEIYGIAPFIIKIVSRRYNCSKGLNKRIRIGFPTNAKEGTQMVMERIDLKKAQAIAKNKGLKPGKVKGTEGVQFTKGKNDRLTVITWEEFENILATRGLAIYESGGWMKIMKA